MCMSSITKCLKKYMEFPSICPWRVYASSLSFGNSSNNVDLIAYFLLAGFKVNNKQNTGDEEKGCS